MNIAAIIPARYNSTRFVGKPLVKINGITMIERVYRQVESSGKFLPKNIIVATDNKLIASAVKEFNGNFVITSSKHRSGTERLWEVLENSNFDAVINIQGDEPIVSGRLISDIFDKINSMDNDVVTPVYYNLSYEDFISKNIVKVVVNNDFMALYFSRSSIPNQDEDNFAGFYQHIGMYGYTKEVLKRFIELPPSKLELKEKLEQLRFLDNSIRIKVIESEFPSIGVDIPGDVAKVEEIINTTEKKIK